MAILEDEGLSLEITFADYHDLWVHYHLRLCWKGTPLLNEAVLRRETPFHASDEPGRVHAEDDRRDKLVATLEGALARDEPAVWTPVEPDVTIALYPGCSFPFIEQRQHLLWTREQGVIDALGDEAAESEPLTYIEPGTGDDPVGAPAPDDLFTLIVLVDQAGLKGESRYCGQGPAVIFATRRILVEGFTRSLRDEYTAFAQRHQVEARFAEEAHGLDPQARTPLCHDDENTVT